MHVGSAWKEFFNSQKGSYGQLPEECGIELSLEGWMDSFI